MTAVLDRSPDTVGPASPVKPWRGVGQGAAALAAGRGVGRFAYTTGQILGPLALTPFLHNGYHQVLLIGAGVVVLAAIAAGALRHRFPHHLGPLPSRVHTTHVWS
jgi:hypothetical protein